MALALAAVCVSIAAAVSFALIPATAKAAWNDPPVVHSASATEITTNSVVLRATITPNNASFEAQFSYCQVGVCSEETKLPLLSPKPEGPGDDPGLNPQNVAIPVTELLPSTEYQVTLRVTTDAWYGGDERPATVKTFTFKTADPVIPVTPVNPKPTTEPVSGLAPTAATLIGKVVPGTTGAPSTKTQAFFQWGPAGGGFPNATKVRNFPTDASEYAISAPLSGLQPNKTYQYRLVAIRGGAQFVGATIQFTTKPEPDCPSGTDYETINHGRVVVVGCFKSLGGLAVAQSEVRLNGVKLTPQGGKMKNPPSFSCGGGEACNQILNYLATGNRFYIAKGPGMLGTTGKWRMSVESIPNLHTGILTKENIDWDGQGPLMTLGANAGVELLDFPLAGQFSFTPLEDGTSRLGLLVGLPEVFGGVTGDTAVKINPGGDISFDRIEIEVGEVAIKKVTLSNLRFLYDRTEDVWEGEAAITLPTPSAIQVGVRVRVKDGKFNEFAGSLDNINYHITYGIYLQKISVLFGLNPVRVGGGIGLTAGPKYAGISLIGVNGDFLLNMESREVQLSNGAYLTYPPSLRLSGEVTIVSIPVREASVEVYFTQFAWVETQFKIGHTFIWNDIAVFGLEGTVGGSLKNTTVDIWGTAGLTVLNYEVASASAILNNDGIAACGRALGGTLAVGGYFPWKTAKPTNVWYCDMDKLREALATASISADDGRVPLKLPKNQPAVVRFTGQGGAPGVRLYGPGGRVIETPGEGVGHLTDDSTYIAFRDELHGTADVLIRNTASGSWSYELISGSPAVTSVKTAGPLPKARVRAKVGREFVTKTVDKVRGKRRSKSRRRATGRYVLRWNLRRIPGQTVTFSEEGRGVPPRVLLRTRKAKGTKAFRPHLLPQRGRRIIATVEQFGRPRARIPVARYTAPRLPRVVRVKKLRAVKRRGRVVVSWKRLPGAGSYRTYTIERNGRRTFHVVTKPRLVLRGRRGRAVKAVIVQPVGVALDLGKRSRVKVAAKPRKRAGAKQRARAKAKQRAGAKKGRAGKRAPGTRRGR